MNTSTDKKLDAILEAIKSLDARVTKIEMAATNEPNDKRSSTSKAKNLSVREFLLQHPPKSDVQRTLAIGYFLEKYKDIGSFTAADLESGYHDAKHKLPSNISMNIKRCIEGGNMMEAQERKDNKPAYVVTATGEQLVEGGFKAVS
jgi:hypothetical protein